MSAAAGAGAGAQRSVAEIRMDMYRKEVSPDELVPGRTYKLVYRYKRLAKRFPPILARYVRPLDPDTNRMKRTKWWLLPNNIQRQVAEHHRYWEIDGVEYLYDDRVLRIFAREHVTSRRRHALSAVSHTMGGTRKRAQRRMYMRSRRALIRSQTKRGKKNRE
jgi:hypothetical protein